MNRLRGAWLVLRGKASWSRQGAHTLPITYTWGTTTSTQAYPANYTLANPPNYWVRYPQA